ISFSLLYYDFFLTLDTEISRVWGASIRLPSILFFANRYGTLLGNIPPDVRMPAVGICQHLATYHQYFIIASQILIGLMLLLRTYALYQRSKQVLIFMILVAVTSIAVAIVRLFEVHRILLTFLQWSVFTGWGGDNSEVLGISLATAWAGSGICDFMVFFLTLYKGLRSNRLPGASLLTTLLRDGTRAFWSLPIDRHRPRLMIYLRLQTYTRGITTTFTNVISSLMISRLMLNLRDPSLLHI
ncbi:hypothetical protein B0H19DRAFT_866597, partial [Mycena capillaripes]